MEVQMGHLASTNASNAAVKSLGAMMVKDHSKANDELKQWASAVGYTLPTGLDADKQKKYDDLKAKKGADFDRAYTDLMVSDHKKDIAEFKEEASKGSETSLKAFAGKTVPTLEHHLMESEKAKSAVK
jgi:putative membrane protein